MIEIKSVESIFDEDMNIHSKIVSCNLIPQNLTLEKITEQNVLKFKENLSKSDFWALRQREFIIKDLYQPTPIPLQISEVNLCTETSIEEEEEEHTSEQDIENKLDNDQSTE